MQKAAILIVEDESIVAKDIQASLVSLGYRVAGMAATGEEAVQRALDLNPDLVLMDVMLKGDMDGIEAAEKIRVACRIPVVYLTAYTDDDTLRRAKVSEAFGYLLKPFEENELRTSIEMALYKHSMERRLSESREWLETTLHCIGDAVIATDSEGNVQLINSRAEGLTGWQRAQAIGRRLTDVFCLKPDSADDGRPVFDISAVLAGQTGGDIFTDVELVGREGVQTPVDCTVTPIREGEASILGVVVVIRDITEIKQAAARERELHERLARARHMESLGALAGGVAKDLNNILGPIASYPDLIMKSLPPDSSIRADLKIIRNSARKAVDVIRDLLTLGRAGHLPQEPVDLNHVVSAALKQVNGTTIRDQAPMVSVEACLMPDAPKINGSAGHLHEMAVNLIINAYAAMPEGGMLRMATKVEALNAPLEGYEIVPAGCYLTLHAMDTGHGLDENDINRIFEPFYIKKKFDLQTVTGLGMAVVYGVVKEHNGYINVISKLGEGTDFIVYLPLGSAESTASAPEPTQEVRGSEIILLVDDEDEQRRYAARWLRSLGYKVLLAANGAKAMEDYSAACAEGAGLDLVILDMIMGDAMDGLDICREIMAQNPRQKVLLVSGFADTDRIKQALKLSGGRYLQKPYTMDELGHAVRLTLDQ